MNIRIALLLFTLLFINCNTNKSKSNIPLSIEQPENMVFIPSNKKTNEKKVNAFWMDETEVTNAQFSRFVDETGYITVAERPVIWKDIAKDLPSNTLKPHDSLLQAGSLVFQQTKNLVPLNNPALWWKYIIGANWKHPNGPNDNIENKENHPVVHITWEDAIAYANWAEKRLPTEAEWEWAAQGGVKNSIYPWGNDTANEEKPKANFWQGLFPHKNNLNDGYLTSAPVKSFPPNNYGLYDMAGNVWEWCDDWYNPTIKHEKVIKGGSFLCNDSYCSGYKTFNRMNTTPDTSLNHTGFRCVKSIPIEL